MRKQLKKLNLQGALQIHEDLQQIEFCYKKLLIQAKFKIA